MIQRIQSIFLLLAALAFGALFKVPFAMSDVAASGFLSDQVYNVFDHPGLIGLTVLGCVVSLIAIFSFRKRDTQRKWGYGVIILGILLPVAAFLLFTNDAPNLYQSGQVHDQFGLFIPLIALVCGFIANYFIRKDDKLVKSMDRLR